mmetsp:Transcript_40450/g.106772  ORF Transcript_40450/g.106772 Transcript_40450/m.106772 type:complete len:336 (+) Transcript_40450:60-1067(+)
MLAAFNDMIYGEMPTTSFHDEEAPVSTQDRDFEGDHGGLNWCYWLWSMAALLALSAWRYALWFAGHMADGGVTAGGWAGDSWLALVGVTFVLTSKFVISSEYILFYWGTAIAYGLRSVGHLLEGCSSTSMNGAYYVVMTFAFGGNAIRAGWGYAMPKSPAATAQRIFTMYAYATLCIFTLRNLKLLLVDGMSKEHLAASDAGNVYEAMEILMGIVEASASLVWYGVTRHEQQGRQLRLIAAATNAAAWTVVKLMPLTLTGGAKITMVEHHFSRHCQYVVIWIMFTLTIKGYVDAISQTARLSSTSSADLRHGRGLLGHISPMGYAASNHRAFASK